MIYKFSRIFLSDDANNDAVTNRIVKFYRDVPVTPVAAADDIPEEIKQLSPGEGKKFLWLTRFKGHFLKPCPGTAERYRCCNYLVINEATNCPIDCSYCILQGYISHPAITVYTNHDRVLDEISALSRANPHRILRIGTGELTDSLALDPVTGLSAEIMKKIRTLPNVILELKSKTDHVDHLLREAPVRTVLSWPVNPEKIVRMEEHKAVPLIRRLQAARLAAEKGFLIGWHFDPIIHFSGWEEGYAELIRMMGEYVDASSIAWISLGSFRYPPGLRDIIRKRFPETILLSGEQIKGWDGKMRYIKPLRRKMYHLIVEKIKEHIGDAFIYFCMESPDLWEDVLGKAPQNNNDVDLYFAASLSRRFPRLNFPQPVGEYYQKPILFPEISTD